VYAVYVVLCCELPLLFVALSVIVAVWHKWTFAPCIRPVLTRKLGGSVPGCVAGR
jgi:hypothetical protein